MLEWRSGAFSGALKRKELMMSRSIYLINPRSDSPSYWGAEVVGAVLERPAISYADLALPTVAAMAPRDWSVELCEGHVTPID